MTQTLSAMRHLKTLLGMVMILLLNEFQMDSSQKVMPHDPSAGASTKAEKIPLPLVSPAQFCSWQLPEKPRQHLTVTEETISKN